MRPARNLGDVRRATLDAFVKLGKTRVADGMEVSLEAGKMRAAALGLAVGRVAVEHKAIYRERNRVERFFNKLKNFRRIATRYDKLGANFFAFIQLASIPIFLRSIESTA